MSRSHLDESMSMLFAMPPTPAVQQASPSETAALLPIRSALASNPATVQDTPQPHASTSTPLFSWPANHPGPPIRLFFDRLSDVAVATIKDLEDELARSGATLPIVTAPHKATHICLDPNDEDNVWLRHARPGQFVVDLRWVEDSFLEGKSKNEADYAIGGPVGGPSTAGPSSSGRMDVDKNETDRQPVGHDDEEDLIQEDSSGSDEEFEHSDPDHQSEEEDDDEGDYEEAEVQEQRTNGYNFLKSAWTSEQQHELAQMLADRTGPFSKVYQEFARRHPERSISAVGAQHFNHRKWYDKASARLQRKAAKQDATDGGDGQRSGSTTQAREQPAEDDDPRPTKKPNPFARTESRPSTTQPQPQPQSSSSSSSSRREPEAFRMVGVAPRHVRDPEGRYCFLCGYGGNEKKYTALRNLVATRVVEGETVYEAVEPRWGCSTCQAQLSQGVSRNEAYVWTREMPRGVAESERLAWVTEKMLIRGMKKRAEKVDG